MKKVMCFGTFDVLHLGHINYFKQAKKYGDYLTVVVARDKTKYDQKKDTVFDECERLELVKQLKVVDEAVLGYPDDHFKIIEEKKPDVICLGYDQKVDSERLLEINIEVHRMEPYEQHQHKSSLIKKQILETK